MRRVEIPELGNDALLGDTALRHGGLEDLRHELVAILSCLKRGHKKLDVNRMPRPGEEGMIPDLLTLKTPKDSISMSM